MLGAAAEAPQPAAAAANWRIDPERTHIAFAIDAVGYPRTRGEFRRFDGRIAVDFDHPDRSSVVFHALSQSVELGSPSFDDFVRSEGFLNAARYPSIDFVSKSVEKIDEHTVRVSGDLTLHRRDAAAQRRRRRAAGTRGRAAAARLHRENDDQPA